MNIELNTPRTLAYRQQYINEISAEPYWNAVGLFEDVEGWKPSGDLRQKLIYDEVCNLTKDIVENRKRIDQWKKSLIKARGEEAEKLVRMIGRWTSYTDSLVGLRKRLQPSVLKNVSSDC